MSDRLAELRRQRALVQEHLAWLDREIDGESKKPPAVQLPGAPHVPVTREAGALLSVSIPASSLPEPDPAFAAAGPAAGKDAAKPAAGKDAAPAAAAAPARAASPAMAPTLTPAPPAAGADSDAIPDEYRLASESLRKDVRKGCFFYFAAAFALLIVGVAILYFTLSR